MAMIKSYTDISQSRKLAEILPLESADMCYIQELLAFGKKGEYKPHVGDLIPAYGQGKIRCWSLAALLSVLSNRALSIDEDTSVILSSYKDVKWDLSICNSGLEPATESDPIDACVEIIYKLKEKDLLQC